MSMGKRLAAVLATLAVALAAFAACIGLAACGDSEAAAPEEGGNITYKEDEGTLTIHNIRDVGEFSGYEVWYTRFEYSDRDYNEVVVQITVDDVYIITAGNPSYKYIIYLEDGSYITLQDAYDQGLVSHEDLEAIAAAEAEHDAGREPRVAYLADMRDVGEYSGYEVYFGCIGLTDLSYTGKQTDITIDGVYITTVSDDMYNYFLYPDGEDEDPLLLSEAYDQGLVSHEDLEAIAAAEAQLQDTGADTQTE